MSFLRSSGGRPPRPFGAIARELFRRKKFQEKGRYGALEAVWRELVGNEMASRTHIASMRGGLLEISVDSPVLLQELDGFMKTQLLDALKASDAGRDLAGLRFRLGVSRGVPGDEDEQEGANGS